jgi:hypothetical protein
MKELKEIMFAEEAVGYLKLMEMLRLSNFDLLLICALQVVIGFTLIALVDMPWAVLGYVMVMLFIRLMGGQLRTPLNCGT